MNSEVAGIYFCLLKLGWDVYHVEKSGDAYVVVVEYRDYHNMEREGEVFVLEPRNDT